MKRQGLALIVVIGILGVLAVLAVAFVAMAQLERRASQQRVNAARAYLLARSGIEDALARLELGQDPAYGGEDWDADGTLSAFEAEQEIYRRTGEGTAADVEGCPVRHALRPSFFARTSGTNPDPALLKVDDRQRGYSGVLAGDAAPRGNDYALKVSSSNAWIHINGGALDAGNRDPDGPGAEPEDFPLNREAAAEVAPLLPNKVPDHRDFSMEGPNGFLVRLLNNLDAIVTNGASAKLGEEIIGARPVGGYKALDELKPILGQARYDQFKSTLTLHAWVDPKVVKPQPMDARPQRWEDIDDTHRIGTPALEISGVKTSGGGGIQLDSLRLGSGKEGDPWNQSITATNSHEGVKTYPVSWEPRFVYAWSQLRLAPVTLEPRSPVSVNRSSPEVLAAVFLGLKGTTLEVWDGSAGWDGGFAWYFGQPTYLYPHPATEETPWIRTRVDYGMTYGGASRPWYGPGDYNPHTPSTASGKPVVQAAPLGRLKEADAVPSPQAEAVAGEIRRRVAQAGPLRTWEQFNAFVDRLPLWEDVDDDDALDGPEYQVDNGLIPYTRRMYRREDWNSDGRKTREIFNPLVIRWDLGVVLWEDPDRTKAALAPGQVPGLTRCQKDVLKSMANPNTDLNDFNPDANLWKEMDKTDLAGIAALPTSYVHTTELALDDAGGYDSIRAVGRVLGRDGRLLALRQQGALARPGGLIRDTTQADFMRAYRTGGQPVGALFSGPAASYPLSGSQALLSYPEPQTVSGGARAADAAYDGQIGLGFIGPRQGPDETFRGALFDTADATATADAAVADLRGPRHAPLLRPAGEDTGSVFPDGVYSEKDRTLRFSFADNFKINSVVFYIACWAKPAWFPEASPRAHTLVSFASGGFSLNPVPLNDIPSRPRGLFFVPARNNLSQDAMGVYVHDGVSTRGLSWPSRCLLWGTIHSFYGSDTLNRRGILGAFPIKPLGRLEAHRWQHLAMHGGFAAPRLVLGRTLASVGVGGWNFNGFPISGEAYKHRDGTPNHLRFGEVAAHNNMNFTADATFANVRAGCSPGSLIHNNSPANLLPQLIFFTDAASPAALGRYYKEDGATYTSPGLPAGIRPQRITWTEIPCDLWFDEDADGWLGNAATGFQPQNDRFSMDPAGQGLPLPLPNGKRDVHIALEVWDDMGTADPSDDVRLARFDNPAADNRIPRPQGRLTYKAVFVNEWDAATRANFPLDVTPFLDDVTVAYIAAPGPRILAWDTDDEG